MFKNSMATTFQIGQVQPSILSRVESIVKNLTSFFSDEEVGDVILAHAYVILMLILIGIGGAL